MTIKSRLNLSLFRNQIGNLTVTVAVTPNGYADAICQNKFVMPEERQMTVRSFLEIIRGGNSNQGNSDNVFYIQKQNSNLSDEFSAIMDDVKPFDWAETAFGKSVLEQYQKSSYLVKYT